MRSFVAVFVACVTALAGCADDGVEGKDGLDELVTLSPKDGDTDIAISSRVILRVDFADSEKCRLGVDNTRVSVTQNGTAVPGTIVYFVDGLRVDFTPSGMFEYNTSYTVSVEVDCAAPVMATFSTRSPPAALPAVKVGDAFRFIALDVDEPSAIAPLIQEFLEDAELVAQILQVDGIQLRMLAGEGDARSDYSDDLNLRAFKRSAFLFPVVGTYKAPYFQIEGRLTVPVNDTDNIVLERFEISGRFVDIGGGAITVAESAIRAGSPCADVCAIDDQGIQTVCANQSLICDSAGDLNLIGDYEGAWNDLGDYQVISLAQAGGTAVPVDTVLDITLSREVNPTASKTVVVEIRANGVGDPIPGTVMVEDAVGPTFGKAAVFTPAAPLAANTSYDILIVAHGAQEFSFSTAP